MSLHESFRSEDILSCFGLLLRIQEHLIGDNIDFKIFSISEDLSCNELEFILIFISNIISKRPSCFPKALPILICIISRLKEFKFELPIQSYSLYYRFIYYGLFKTSESAYFEPVNRIFFYEGDDPKVLYAQHMLNGLCNDYQMFYNDFEENSIVYLPDIYSYKELLGLESLNCPSKFIPVIYGKKDEFVKISSKFTEAEYKISSYIVGCADRQSTCTNDTDKLRHIQLLSYCMLYENFQGDDYMNLLSFLYGILNLNFGMLNAIDASDVSDPLFCKMFFQYCNDFYKTNDSDYMGMERVKVEYPFYKLSKKNRDAFGNILNCCESGKSYLAFNILIVSQYFSYNDIIQENKDCYVIEHKNVLRIKEKHCEHIPYDVLDCLSNLNEILGGISLYGAFDECKNLEYITYPSSNSSRISFVVKQLPRHINFIITREDTVLNKSLAHLRERWVIKDERSNDVNKLTVSFKDTDITEVKEVDFTELMKIFDMYDTISFRSMFENCKKLTSVSFPSSFNTNKVVDMSYMFSGCVNLKNIHNMNFDTSNVEYMDHMFYDCSSITDVDVSSFDTSKVKSMKYLFGKCEQLETINVSNFNTSSLEDMSGMFLRCFSITSLDLSNFNTKNVSDMKELFSHCYKLVDLKISSFDTKNLVDMCSMFTECSAIVRIDLSSFDTSKVVFMSNVFSGCSSLEEVIITNFNTSNVVTMKRMFHNCVVLKSLDLQSFNTSACTDMESMFGNCRHIKILCLSSFNTSLVQNMSCMFYNCWNATEIILDSFNTSSLTSMDYMFSNCRSVRTLNLSTFNTSNIKTFYGLFNGCTELQSIIFSEYFDTSNAISFSGMFWNCKCLENLDISKFNTKNVREMTSLFDGCQSLTSLNLKNFNTSNVTTMWNMFHKCSSLTSLDLSSFDTGKVIDLRSIFNGCQSLESVILNSFDTSNVTTMMSMFSNCEKLKEIDLSSFTTNNVKYMNFMFYNCSSLTSINLKNFDTSNVHDMSYMFGSCYQLETLDLHSFNTSQVQYFSGMFRHCINLKDINMPLLTADAAQKMDYMFFNCRNLKNVTLPELVITDKFTTSHMFSQCDKMETLVYSTKNKNELNTLRDNIPEKVNIIVI